MNIVEFCQLWHYIVIYTVQLYTQYITHSRMCIEGYIMDIILAFILTIYNLTFACSPSSIILDEGEHSISFGWKMWACLKIEPLKYQSEVWTTISSIFCLLIYSYSCFKNWDLVSAAFCNIMWVWHTAGYVILGHLQMGLDHRERRWICLLVVVAQHYGNSMFLLG